MAMVELCMFPVSRHPPSLHGPSIHHVHPFPSRPPSLHFPSLSLLCLCPLARTAPGRCTTNGGSAPPSSSAAADAESNGPPLQTFHISAIDELQASLMRALQGLNRGVFGVPSSRKMEIEELIERLEKQNPLERPTENLVKVNGEWRLLYSTISILGSKRTKLGLRDFVTLGDFLQLIDVEQSKAINTITFSVAGLGMLTGALTIEATYSVSSPTRVDIRYEKSNIVPDQLLNLFRKSYDLLLSIFNPEGWLEITYVDDNLRIGRDDKGNIFLLERTNKGSSWGL